MNKTEDELISISILTYRNYRYLYEALESVFSQDYSNIELIVSDDGSDNFPWRMRFERTFRRIRKII